MKCRCNARQVGTWHSSLYRGRNACPVLNYQEWLASRNERHCHRVSASVRPQSSEDGPRRYVQDAGILAVASSTAKGS